MCSGVGRISSGSGVTPEIQGASWADMTNVWVPKTGCVDLGFGFGFRLAEMLYTHKRGERKSR